MRKYLYIFKSELMSNFQYVFNILSGFIGYLVMMFIFLNLWQYIYSDPNELINGYSMNQMIWYVIFAEVLYMSISGRKLSRKISNDVKSGNIAYNINKPYSYIGYIISNTMGSVAVKFVIYFILAILTGLIFLGVFPSINAIQFILILISSLFAIIINTVIIIIIGLISFFIEDSQPIYWIYSKIILIVGTIFPIEYFPVSIQKFLKFTPAYVTSYGPAKLFVDFNYNSFLNIIIAQIIYLIIVYLLCLLIYKKGVKKLNVNGG